MAVNYDDERFAQVEADKGEAMTELEQTYAGITGETDKYYQAQIDAAKEWGDKQSQLQQEQTDFAIEQIGQQKEQAEKDYTKEQSAAYVDWQKQSNEYGTEAEKMASAGLANTGFSESSQVGMYNAYQNRVATARESYNQAILNYNNAIKDARLQNNSALAEIAYQSLQQQLELSLQGFQYKNQLILEQANKKVEMDNMYWGRYQDVLNQINTENALDEQIRQFNQTYAMQVKEYEEGIRQFNEEIARLKAKDAQEYALEIQKLEQDKQKMEEAKRQFEAEMAFKEKQLAEEKRQFNTLHSKSKSSSSSSRSSSSSSKKKSTGSAVVKQTSTKATVDNKSVLNLGYGPISAENLAGKVASGTVKATQTGNKITFTKTGKVPSTKFDKYTSFLKK